MHFSNGTGEGPQEKAKRHSPKSKSLPWLPVAVEIVQIARLGIQDFMNPAVLYLLRVSGGEGFWAWESGRKSSYGPVFSLCEIMDSSLNASRSQFLHL